MSDFYLQLGLDLALRNLDSSFKLTWCLFVPNFAVIGHLTLILRPENRPESMAKKTTSIKNGLVLQKLFCMVQNIKKTFISINPPSLACLLNAR